MSPEGHHGPFCPSTWGPESIRALRATCSTARTALDALPTKLSMPQFSEEEQQQGMPLTLLHSTSPHWRVKQLTMSMPAAALHELQPALAAPKAHAALSGVEVLHIKGGRVTEEHVAVRWAGSVHRLWEAQWKGMGCPGRDPQSCDKPR